MLFLERTEHYTYTAVQRILGGQILRESLKVRVRLLEADPRFQSPDCGPPARPTLGFRPYRLAGLRIGNEWAPQLNFALCSVTEQFRNLARHDSDNRVRFVIDPNGFAQYGWIAMEPSLPEVVAQNGFKLISPLVFFVPEQTPQQRLDAQDFEILGWD